MKNISLTFNKNLYLKIISIVLGFIYLSFIIFDFFFKGYGNISSMLKFASIVIIFLAQLFYGNDGMTLWKMAAAFTILTDYILLFTSYYEWGVFFFIIVHLMRYIERIRIRDKDFPYNVLLLGIGLYLIAKILLPNLIALSLTYALFLFLNTMDAFNSKDKKLIYAYVLFCACDLSVGIANVEYGLISSIFRDLIWIFYMPSQILLARKIIDLSK